MSKKIQGEEYNEHMVVARSDGDIHQSRRVGRRGETWDAPELNIAPPVTHPPVPLLKLSRQGRKARHAGRVIFINTESTPPQLNPAFIFHSLTLAEEDSAAGRTKGMTEEDSNHQRICLLYTSPSPRDS